MEGYRTLFSLDPLCVCAWVCFTLGTTQGQAAKKSRFENYNNHYSTISYSIGQWMHYTGLISGLYIIVLHREVGLLHLYIKLIMTAEFVIQGSLNVQYYLVSGTTTVC